MTNKQELRKYIDNISEEDAKIILAFLKRFVPPVRESKPLDEEEIEAFMRGEQEMATGQYLTLEEFEQGKRI